MQDKDGLGNSKERTKSPFSPTRDSVMNNFFSGKGPIKPPSMG